jgi:hypothetical protein
MEESGWWTHPEFGGVREMHGFWFPCDADSTAGRRLYEWRTGAMQAAAALHKEKEESK